MVPSDSHNSAPTTSAILPLTRNQRPRMTSLDVECFWNLKAHGDTWEGKWRGNWRMEWVASTLILSRNMVYPALLTLMRTARLPAVDWTDASADLNGLVRFGERRNLVSALVPSHFKRTIHYFCSLLVVSVLYELHTAYYSAQNDIMKKIGYKTRRESTVIYTNILPNIFTTVLSQKTRKFRFNVSHYTAFQ